MRPGARAGSVLPAGSPPRFGPPVAFLEDLPGQPYYITSAALGWQYSTDRAPGQMRSALSIVGPATRKRGLPARPTLGGRHFTKQMAILVSATGSNGSGPANSVTMNFSLGWRYRGLSTTVGLADALDRAAMVVKFAANGNVLSSTTLAPRSLPASVTIDLGGVVVLQLVVSNVSGTAPNWRAGYQFAPGAVVLADPRLST